MIKHNLAICLNTQRPDKNGLFPVRFRTIIKGVTTYYPTGIMLKKDQLVKGEVVKHPNKESLNRDLRKRFNEIEGELLTESYLGEQTIKNKKAIALKFADYANKKIEFWKSTQAKVTTDHKASYLNKFVSFKPDIKLKDVTKEVMAEYETYCKTKGNINNTVWSATKAVKTILNAAVDDGLLQKSPLKGFKGTKYKDPLRKVLTVDEVNQMEEFADNHINSEKLRHVAGWFILGCYSGLRYGDMVAFKGIVNERLLFQTKKTGAVVSMIATEQIKRAWARITRPIGSNQKCNDYIQTVCALLNIDKKINWHCCRHTFGVNFINGKGDVYILSKLMGHNSIKTTSIYAQIANPRIDEEMKKVFGNG